jgi:hypothetical protein
MICSSLMSARVVAGFGRPGTPAVTSQLCTVCAATPNRSPIAASVNRPTTHHQPPPGAPLMMRSISPAISRAKSETHHHSIGKKAPIE